MNNLPKLITLFLLLQLVIGCFNKDKEQGMQEENAIFLKDDKAFLKACIKSKVEKEFGEKFTSSTQINVNKKAVATADLDKDGLFDVVAFLAFFNKRDNAFKETRILYYRNTGKDLILKETKKLYDYRYVYPEERISDENHTWNEYIVFTREITPDDFGRLDLTAKAKEGSLHLTNGKLSYGVYINKENGNEHEYFNEDNVSEDNYYKYVSAESGLIYRHKPEGEALGKFPYGTQVHIIGKTGIEKTIYDDGEEITGEWVQVELDEYNEETAYVFDGFLDEEYNLSYEKRILNTPIEFENSNEKGLILPGSYQMYNEALNAIGGMVVNEISDITILQKTTYKRPENEDDAYCEWSNYVKVNYNGKDLILFGSKLLDISATTAIKEQSGAIIYLIEAENFTVEAADYDGLTGCDDYSDIFIKQNNTYSHIYNKPIERDLGKLVFVHDEGGSDSISSFEVKNDTIVFNIVQGFQEGTGSYKLKVFNENGWKYIETDHKREYP